MSSQPVALITCKVGSEELCAEEIGNVLYPYDNSVSIIKTKYRGLIIAYSKLNPSEAYMLLSKREYGFVKSIIPIQASLMFERDQLIYIVKKIAKDVSCVRIKLRVRGVRGLSQSLWRDIINALREAGLKHDLKCSKCLFIEVVDDNVYVGLRDCFK